MKTHREDIKTNSLGGAPFHRLLSASDPTVGPERQTATCQRVKCN